MADLNFPASPIDGQTYGEYTYVGSKGVWQSIPGLPAGVPAGTILGWGGSTAPDQWLICDGSAVSRSTYSSLFAAIGTTYGIGDGSTTFNLPDLRGKVPVGSSSATSLGTATITNASPAVVTTSAHGLATGQIIYFTTTGTLPTGLSANTRYWVIVVGSTTFRLATSLANALAGTAINTSSAGSGTHTAYSADFELGRSNGENNHIVTTTEMPSHQHSLPGDAYYNRAGTGWFTSINQTVYLTYTAENTGFSGGNIAHNNLQPYQVVNYIIKYSAAYVPQESELVPRINNLEVGSRNYLINADFAINQRGFTSTTGHGVYGLDRWQQGVSGGTSTYSTQAFAVGSAPVSGYEAINYARIVVSGQSAAGDFSYLQQQIENVRILSGQTATVSFWARSGSGTPKVAVAFEQMFGSGGSPSASVTTYAGQVVLSTSWTRYSVTVNIPSISGKTLGTTANTSALRLQLWTSAGTTYNTNTGSLGVQANTFDFWGVQVESGSYATPFKINSSNVQAELLMCQRYYSTGTMGGTYYIGSGNGVGIGAHDHSFVPMRVAPTSTVTSFVNNDNAVNNGVMVLGNGRVNGNFRNNNTGFPYYYFNATFKLEAEL